MSGHNKWSKIKHKKASSDAQKSRVFSRFVKLIQNESKKSGGDTNSPGLRSAVDSAKKENIPKDNIERAIIKGLSLDTKSLVSATYETYGPGGVAIIIEALTDNTNRTGALIKNILTKKGLSLSAPGSASWAFERVGGEWTPKTFIDVGSERESLEEIIESLDAQEDVQGVYINAK